MAGGTAAAGSPAAGFPAGADQVGAGNRGPGGRSSEIGTWVQQTFSSTTVGGRTVYDLTQPRG